jgi:heme-degrading monooxygenase HmoA
MNSSTETRAVLDSEAEFVAINFISCKDHYRGRFEELFATRAGAIDRMPGFKRMQVLKPNKDGEAYLIVSYWNSEDEFKAWTGSEEFLEGHKRGFEDIRLAKERGEEPPMTSSFVTYDVIAR